MPHKSPGGCLSVLLPFLNRFAPSETADDTPASGADKTGGAIDYPYDGVPALLTPAERSFYGVLLKARSGTATFICCKVRLADLVSVRRGADKPRAAFNRVSAKHVDFVLCDGRDTRPLAAIELDDASHARKSRRDRDDFLAACLSAAGLPLLRVEAARAYSVETLRALVEPHLPPQS